MQIDKLGFYKTRAGHKAEVSKIHSCHLSSGFVGGTSICWYSSGNYSLFGEHALDLVSEWVEADVPQHKKIAGYRDLTQDEIDLMNEGKALAEQVGAFVTKLEADSATDKRWAAIGKTDLQMGFMSLIRSIARPTTF